MAPAPTTSGLAWLLHPVTEQAFVDSYQGLKPFVVRGRSAHYLHGLPALDEIDGLISATSYNGNNIDGRLVRTDEEGTFAERRFRRTASGQTDIYDIYRAFSDGFTVVLNGLESRTPNVAAVCRQLESDLQHRVGANLYLTPQAAQGAQLHTDSHDVFLLQLHGQKHWKVARQRGEITKDVAGSSLEAVDDTEEWMLGPGDCLYIPRGFAHAGLSGNTSSLHITFGITVVTRKDLLLETINVLAEDDATLGDPLPTGYLDKSLHASVIDQLVATLSAAKVRPAIETSRLALGSRLLQRQTAVTGHFSSLVAIKTLTIESSVILGFVGPARLRPEEGGEAVVLEFPGNYLSVPVALSTALKYALTTKKFQVGELPAAISDREKVAFIAMLIREGFLAIWTEKESGKNAPKPRE